MPIRFFEDNIKSNLKHKRQLAAFINSLISAEKNIKKTDITYVFCSEDFLFEMNKQFLQHDTHTDIITFDLSESDTVLKAEIYISIPRVKDNAEKFEVDYNNELHRVLFHGALHLCGHKDKTIAQQQQMREAENNYLKKYFSTSET